MVNTVSVQETVWDIKLRLCPALLLFCPPPPEGIPVSILGSAVYARNLQSP